MEHIFIINPCAGQGKAEKMIHVIEEALQGTAYQYSIYTTKAAGDAEHFVRETCESGRAVRFYVCGGDGSFHEAVNGVKGFPQAEVGLFPMGTGNDFVRNFGKKSDFMDIFSQVEGKSIPCDVIELNGRYVVNMANIGFDCEVAAKAAEWKKKPLVSGPAAYIMGILSEFAKPMGNRMSFRWSDGTTMTGKYLLCTIANGSFCGGGFCSSPEAALNDGLMDVGIVQMIPRRKFVGILPKYKTGTYLDTKLGKEKVLYGKYNKLELAVAEPTHICIDGEISKFTYLKAEMVPQAFRFIVPKGLEAGK
ncbi:MAG: YegS/Rv2252/BmrU family lipid kinase [Anaerotignum sp.]|nr:YegS/Rv2252/BmrU family lipid kinase [Anaerotignum sp.]MBR5794106.1 YegS/Rv2252/BmrU family lipid kinase [Anaerotignum sp.]